MDNLEWYKNLVVRIIGFDESNFALLDKEDEIRVKDNEELMLGIINADPLLFSFASARLKNDRGFVIKAVTQDNIPYKDIPGWLQKDHDIALIAATKKTETVQESFLFIPDELKEQKEFVKKVVRVNGIYLNYVDEIFKFDEEIVRMAYKNNPEILNHISDDLVASIINVN
jgi:hypothetical protein